MKNIEQINNMTKDIKEQILQIVQNQTYSLTQKNILMKPLIEEDKVLKDTIKKLTKIKNSDFFGACNGKN